MTLVPNSAFYRLLKIHIKSNMTRVEEKTRKRRKHACLIYLYLFSFSLRRQLQRFSTKQQEFLNLYRQTECHISLITNI